MLTDPAVNNLNGGLSAVSTPLFLTPLCVLILLMAAAPALGSAVLEGSEAAYLDRCIRDTETMRRDHMRLLNHKRDETVYQGIRSKDASLTECVACHAVKKPDGHFKPVTEPGQFCSSCHQQVGKRIDCFSCHRSTPDPKTSMQPDQP